MGQRHGNRLYRVRCAERSYVLKVFDQPAQATEVRSYALLQEIGVPTLPVYGRTENAILLEDLSVSPTWRLAEETDVERPETGAAVAKWYLTMHARGEELLAGSAEIPSFLQREADQLDGQSITATGKKLGLGQNLAWKLAAVHIQALKEAMRSLPETLNYNDFHWSNLALQRCGAAALRRGELRAVVFDYHLLGIGPRYSDCRNVVGSLGKRAARAFWEAYGPVDEREAILDEPISILYGLQVASRRPRLPEWARAGMQKVESGELERSLRRALEIV